MTETSSFYGNNPTPSEVQSAEDLLAQANASIDLVLNNSAAASASALAASTSATNAASSASAAAASAALASTNGANASTDAATASTKAAAAAQSAADAAASASSIASQVSTATTKASEALTSANNAAGSASAAAASATAADGSKTAAATSASNAATSASNAASAASTAATSAVSSALTSYYTKTQSDSNYYSKTQSDANYYTKAQSDTALATKQASLGFTPVQQGTGIGQQTNVIKIGQSPAGPKLTVDSTDLGLLWLDALVTLGAAGNGYIKLPNGLIVQWGSAFSASTDYVQAFPIAFPTACYTVVSSPENDPGTSTLRQTHVDQITSSGFTIRNRSVSGSTVSVTGNLSVRWIAIGK